MRQPAQVLDDQMYSAKIQVHSIDLVSHCALEQEYEDSTCKLPNNMDQFHDEQEEILNGHDFHRARRLLCLMHFFAQFSKLAWQFSISLLLAAITNYQSLVLVSTYGLTVSIAVCLGSAPAGQYIDGSSNRLPLIRRLIFLENISVVLATICCYLLLSSSSTPEQDAGNTTATSTGEAVERNFVKRFENVPSDTHSMILLFLVHIAGALAATMDRAFSIAIERDWVVVVCHAPTEGMSKRGVGDEAVDLVFPSRLSDTNIMMRIIYLVCKVSAPAIAGFFIPLLSRSRGQDRNPTGSQMKLPCVFVGALTMSALFVEYICTTQIYESIPALAFKRLRKEDDISLRYKQSGNQNIVGSREMTLENQDIEDNNCVGLDRQRRRSHVLKPPNALELSSFRVYISQSVALFGLALAVLNINPLTFGNGIMTTYLLSRGMALERVGLLRGLSAAVGFFGTLTYKFLYIQKISLEAIATYGVASQFLFVVVSLFSVLFASHTRTSLILLTGGECLSRIGLWTFDIAVTQLQQERVPESSRAIVGGFQESIDAFCNLAAFGLGIAYPDPDDFFIFVVTSALSVGIALVLTIAGLTRTSSHVYNRTDTLQE
jgi:solute carrier family 40 (iron-regulated transporter), member 1